MATRPIPETGEIRAYGVPSPVKQELVEVADALNVSISDLVGAVLQDARGQFGEIYLRHSAEILRGGRPS